MKNDKTMIRIIFIEAIRVFHVDTQATSQNTHEDVIEIKAWK